LAVAVVDVVDVVDGVGMIVPQPARRRTGPRHPPRPLRPPKPALRGAKGIAHPPRLLFLVAALVLCCGSLSAQAPGCDLNAGPHSVVEKASERDRANYAVARNYTFIEQRRIRQLDSNGNPEMTHQNTMEIMFIYGERVERMLAKDGKPVSDKEKAKEDDKIDKLIRERENETADEKQKRLEKADKERAEEREVDDEIADAFNFTVLPSEPIDGHTAYVIDAEPKPGYQPRSKQAKLLPKFHFRVWLNAEDCNWIKLDAEALDTIALGGILARIGKGAHVEIEQTQVNGEVWLPRHIAIKAGARILLLKKLNLDADFTYSDYRKFRTETRILSTTGDSPPKAEEPGQEEKKR
jgi:hypothetical protein